MDEYSAEVHWANGHRASLELELLEFPRTRVIGVQSARVLEELVGAVQVLNLLEQVKAHLE